MCFDLKELSLGVVLGLVAPLTSPGDVQGRIWKVEKDGSGDYGTIQEALDAASPGDTVRVGPGRYTEYKTAGQTLHYYALIDVDDLTIEGVDPDLVFLGPELEKDTLGVGVSNLPGVASTTLGGITIENMFTGAALEVQELTVRNVTFRTLEQDGIGSYVTGVLLVDGCRFEGILSRGVIQLDVPGVPAVLVRDCEFRDSSMGIDSQESNNTIEDCSFIDNTVGIQFSAIAAGTIQRCTFEDNSTGVVLTSRSIGSLIDNQFSGGQGSLWINNDSVATGSGNIFNGGSYSTIYLTGEGTAILSDNHILALPGSYSARVNSSFGPGHEIDLRNNYWGTTDIDAISASILDANDDELVTGTVLFEPFHGRPVSSEATSFGRLKASYD